VESRPWGRKDVLRDYFAKGFDASHPKICFPLSAFRALAVASRRSVSKAAEQHLRGIGMWTILIRLSLSRIFWKATRSGVNYSSVWNCTGLDTSSRKLFTDFSSRWGMFSLEVGGKFGILLQGSGRNIIVSESASFNVTSGRWSSM